MDGTTIALDSILSGKTDFATAHAVHEGWLRLNPNALPCLQVAWGGLPSTEQRKDLHALRSPGSVVAALQHGCCPRGTGLAEGRKVCDGNLPISLGRLLSADAYFPTGVGLLDFKLNSSPRPELFSSRSTPRSSLECPTPECPWSAQPQSISTQSGDVRSKAKRISVFFVFLNLKSTCAQSRNAAPPLPPSVSSSPLPPRSPVCALPVDNPLPDPETQDPEP